MRVVAVVVAFAASLAPPVAHADRAAPPHYRSTAKTKAMLELERFIFEGDPYQRGRPPVGLDAKQVGQYIAGALERTSAIEAWHAAAFVAERYAASEAAPAMAKLLDKSEQSREDDIVSISAARIALQGDAKSAAKAVAYLPYLAGHVSIDAVGDEMLALFAVAGASADPRPLEKAIGPQNPLYNDLQRIESAHREELKLLGETDRAKRLAAFVDIYAALDPTTPYPEYLATWAGKRLQRESWAAQPGEFIARAPNKKLRAQVAAACRDALPRAQALSPNEATFARVKLLHAITFFGGTLTADEKAALAADGAGQTDELM